MKYVCVGCGTALSAAAAAAAAAATAAAAAAAADYKTPRMKNRAFGANIIYSSSLHLFA